VESLSQKVHTVSPSGLVPFLKITDMDENQEITVNDSLAICEFLADLRPDLPLWPHDWQLRSRARSAAAEMHSGFVNIRNEFSTNFVAKYTGDIPISVAARKEIERLFTLWTEARRFTVRRLRVVGQQEKDNGFLFGAFGVVDALFWPVLWVRFIQFFFFPFQFSWVYMFICVQRFRSYSLPLDTASPEALEWMRTMWSDPVMRAQADEYFQQAEDPETVIDHYDDVYRGRQDIQCGTFERDWTF
jgi:glutathione S-transferase